MQLSNLKSALTPGLKLGAVLVAAALASGCLSAKSKSGADDDSATADPVQPAQPASPITPPPAVPDTWTVARGEHLWGISGVEDVYNVPEKWPLLYKANIDQIEDADLIFPGQVLDIPRDSGLGEIEAAIQHARSRGAWSVGPVEDSDKAYLRKSP